MFVLSYKRPARVGNFSALIGRLITRLYGHDATEAKQCEVAMDREKQAHDRVVSDGMNEVTVRGLQSIRDQVRRTVNGSE